MNHTGDDDTIGRTFGERLRYYRDRAGLSRPVFGGLIGRSAEWVKAVENNRLRMPPLPMLVRVASVLQVDDLADLTGEQRMTAASYTKNSHEALSPVATALADYAVGTEPIPVAELDGQVRQAWDLWHGSRRHRTAIAVVLPSLIGKARTAARAHDGNDRRRASALLAQVYHLTQLFLSFQPVPDLIMVSGDRAMNAALDADDPHAIAAGAWYVNHIHRDAGTQAEARIELAAHTAALLHPEASQEDLARWGLLQLAMALSHAKIGRAGDAWRHWDAADRAARGLGDGYSHPWLIFGRGIVDAYQITMHNDLMEGGKAVAAADKLNLAAIPSATRRSYHIAETARAFALKREPVATVTLLNRAFEESPDTTRFSMFARSEVPSLAETGGATVRADAAVLATKLGLLTA